MKRQAKPEIGNGDSIRIDLDGIIIGGDELTIIAGPCAVEGKNSHDHTGAYDRTLELAEKAKSLGIKFLRGGAFKPRNSAHSFQGMGEAALEILQAVKQKTGMYIVTELVSDVHIPLFDKYGVDIIQIGMRNANNYWLIAEAGKTGKPILLKRGDNKTVDNWLSAAEYIAVSGNYNIMMCERGTMPIDSDASRNLADPAAIKALRRKTWAIPAGDPSHSAGDEELVGGIARDYVRAGAKMLEIETIRGPQDIGRCDFKQGVLTLLAEATRPDQTTLEGIMMECVPLYRRLNPGYALTR